MSSIVMSLRCLLALQFKAGGYSVKNNELPENIVFNQQHDTYFFSYGFDRVIMRDDDARNEIIEQVTGSSFLISFNSYLHFRY